MKLCRPLLVLTSLAFLLFPGSAQAEDSVRQCIRFAPSGERLLIPAGQIVHVGNIDFHLDSKSDAVFLNSFFWQDSGTPPGSYVSYHMHLDGGDVYRMTPQAWYGMRTPWETDRGEQAPGA